MNGALTGKNIEDLRDIAARSKRAQAWLNEQISNAMIAALGSSYREQLQELRRILTGKFKD